jgi:2'-5' RNA ligase
MPSLDTGPDSTDESALMDAPATPDTLTIGVAVALPEPYASELRDFRASFGDTEAEAVPTHVTLLPPTEVDSGALGEVQQHLGLVARRHRAFPMRLRGTGTFRPVSPVVFVAVARGISECELLAGAVRSGPLDVETAFPYHPHVTVAHDVPTDMLDMASAGLAELQAEFRVSSFTEFEQLPDGAWAVAREYPLTGPAR